MSTSAGLSTVSELVKQKSLLNNLQYTSAKQGLEFAETAIKTTILTNTSKQNKVEHSFHKGLLTKADYDKQLNQLKNQLEMDCAPWQSYVEKLSQLIEQYPTQNVLKGKQKRSLEQSSSTRKTSPSSKRNRITFSSTSSDSDTPEPPRPPPPPVTTQIKSKPISMKHDACTSTEPLEFSLRSPFHSTPNIISFTAQTNHVTQRIPLQQINEIAAKQIVLLHDEGQLVRWNDVIWRILTYFHVQDLGHLAVHRADQIPCIDNLLRTQNKINVYLDGYTYSQTIGTLNELETDLAGLFSKKNYQDLLIGPCEKQPKIVELFRLRSLRNEQVQKNLKSSDVLKYLDQYMTKEYAWKTDSEINLEPFLKYVAEQVHVKNTSELGIRIKSVYFARNCIKAMQANQRKTLEIARNELNEILADRARKEVDRIHRAITDKLDGQENEQQRRLYATMDPIDVIDDLIEICRDLCQNYPSFRKISQALSAVSDDAMLRNIFQIAICRGRLALPSQTGTSTELTPKAKSVPNKKIYFDSSDSEDELETTPTTTTTEVPKAKVIHPNESEILQAFKEQTNSLKVFTLNILSRIEQRLCDKFQVKHFHELGQGTFMNYIQHNEQVLFPVTTKITLSSSESKENDSKIGVALKDLEDFLLQVSNKSIDEQHMQQLICYHFQVESFEQLSHGSFRSVLDSVKQDKKRSFASIHYECILTDETPILNPSSSSRTYRQDLEKEALDAIDQCPLLGNLSTDTQWNRRFRPFLGQIKPFLSRHALPTLEIDHTTSLKLSSNSTLDMFKESLDNYDSMLTSGHLVSLVVHYGSLQNAPLSLLSNIIHTFLSTVILDHRLYRFLLHMFLRIPFLLLTSTIQRLFLEPLIKLEGSQVKVREKLWRTIDKHDVNMLLRLVELGKQLGFTEWSMSKLNIEPPISIPREEKQLSSSSIPVVTAPILVSKVEQTFSGDSPHDFIERLRREKFGIGLNLSSEGQCLTEQLKSLVGRSLERLSKELYNSDMHFVLELIQNADDNQYQDPATLVFVINSQAINIYNNELGFQEKHIQALCDIGKSTKGKHQQGYIGQKGIGFKSVFTICDRPEIYSNGYRICFDAQNGSIGFILPEWLDDDHRETTYLNWKTRICLPLKSANEMQKHKSRSLTESFSDIHPSLLLFLNRLRSITIDNRLTNSKQTYERIDIPGTSIVEIHCGQMIEKWFVLKKQVIIPEEIQASLDHHIEATEIALAFPLHEIQSEGEVVLSKQDVYAYLPLRTFGFTFIIQADFEVPSSRQDILSDSVWNEFLLHEIPSLFLSSLDAFQREQSSLLVDPLRLFLYFLPDETSIYHNNHLFTSVCRTILRSLRSRPFLPVINDNHLHMPNECVIINDSTLREILTPELLYNHLHLYYLQEDFHEHEKQFFDLGVHRLGHSELIDIIKRIFTSEIVFHEKTILSKWFSCLYRCLKELPLIDEQKVLKDIQLLKIFPLKNRQEFVALNQRNEAVFFPAVHIRLSQLIEGDLMIIDEDLWADFPENSIERTQIQTLLERLGVQRLTSRAVCEQHIFPIFESERIWREKPTDILVAYVMFIFEVWTKQKHDIDISRFKSIAQLLTNDGFKQHTHHPIHFTQKYDNPYDLSKDFDTYHWILLSDEYLHGISSSNDRKKLRQFFLELGVCDFLLPVHHWTGEQFQTLIQSQSISMNKKLFLALQETWSTSNDDEVFLKLLQESTWIPMTHRSYSYNEQTNQIDSTKIQQLDKAEHVYIKSKQMERLFAHHVPYLDIEVDHNSSFGHDLGLIENLTLSDVISMLLHWCEQTIFSTSLSHMANVYDYIYQNMPINELRELVQNKPIFFVPTSPSDHTSIIQGRFHAMSDVCWSDPTNLFAKYSAFFRANQARVLIEPYYPEQKSIFLDTFSIPLNPTIEEYINLLTHIASLETTEETVRDAFLIFQTIGKWSEQSNTLIEKDDLQNQLLHKSVFPTNDYRWVSLTENPLICNNDPIAQLFTQTYSIPFINTSSPDVITFLSLCDIKSFASSIIIEHVIENPMDESSIASLLSPLVPYIQLYMKSRPEFASAYQWTRSINMSSVLLRIQFYTVDSLQLIYRLKSTSSMCIIREEKSYYDRNEMIFYVHREWMEQPKYSRNIFHAFAGVFFSDYDQESIRLLGNFINLLYNEEENSLESFAKYQHFDLELNDPEDVSWQITSISNPMKFSEPKIDENKVRTLLEDVAQSQEQYSAYQKKKRNESKKHCSETAMISSNSSTEYENTLDETTTTADGVPRLDQIRPNSLSSFVNTSYENVAQHVKKFNIDDLTHQVLANRNSAIGSNQESLEKIGRWGERWVNEYLHGKYHNQIQSNEIEVFWLNETLEQGKPYDFLLKNLRLKTITFIEVKSTLSTNRQLIPITLNEIQHCCSLSDMNEQFQIYRVYNTGQLKKVKLHIVENVEEKLRKHALELFLLI